MNMPRVFVRVINSSREIHAAIRFRKTLCSSLLGEPHVYMLFIVDMQTFEGAMSIEGQDGHGLLFYAIRESETTHNITQGAEAFRLCSETYTRAIAFAITHWAAGGSSENVQMFANLNELCAACVQFDGGDTGRELFTPRKFYGQQMETFSEKCRLQNLFARIQTQMFMLPQEYESEAACGKPWGGCIATIPQRLHIKRECGADGTGPPDSSGSCFSGGAV